MLFDVVSYELYELFFQFFVLMSLKNNSISSETDAEGPWKLSLSSPKYPCQPSSAWGGFSHSFTHKTFLVLIFIFSSLTFIFPYGTRSDALLNFRWVRSTVFSFTKKTRLPYQSKTSDLSSMIDFLKPMLNFISLFSSTSFPLPGKK